MTEIAKIWKILPHKNALKPWFSWKIWWGSKKPLKFSGFLLLKKKIFAYLAWNLKNSATFCHNTEVKPSKIWFSLENQVPLPFFCNFAIFGVHFHQLFATDIRWSLEKFDFLRKISDFYQFCHFRSPFSPTFRHGPKVKPWKIWFLDFLSILSKSKSNFQNFLPQGAWSLENFEKTADFRRK